MREKIVFLKKVLLSMASIRIGVAVASLLLGSGCVDHGKTLIDTVQMPAGERITLVEKLDVNSRHGLLSSEDLLGAKIVKKVDQPTALEAFRKILIEVVPGNRNVSHPLALGECVLRVKTDNGVFFVFCQVEKAKQTRYCILLAGGSGETNQNFMTRYESEAIPVWLDENGLQ